MTKTTFYNVKQFYAVVVFLITFFITLGVFIISELNRELISMDTALQFVYASMVINGIYGASTGYIVAASRFSMNLEREQPFVRIISWLLIIMGSGMFVVNYYL